MMLRAGCPSGIQNPVRPLLAWRHDSPPQQQDYGMKRQNALDRSNRDGGGQPQLSGRVRLPARMLGAVAALTLTACATAPEPRVITRTVEVPVSVPCAVSVTEPAYVDTDEAIAGAPNLYELSKLFKAGRLQRIGALGEYRAAVKGCAKP